MSFRLHAETPIIGAAPGETVTGRLQIHNDGTTDAVFTVTVVGLEADPFNGQVAPTSLQIPVQAGAAAVADVAVVVPRSLGIGQHATAFEVTSSRSGDRAALSPFTLSIASVARVELVPQPSTIRGRRRARFHLDVTNNEPQPVEVELIGEAPDVEVAFSPSVVGLSPGQRIVAKATLKGPRHLSGEPTQHNVLITARGRAATTTTTAAYVQRPLFAQRLRMVVAGLTVIALWLGAIGGVALWWTNRDQGPDTVALFGEDTDGDGIVDSFVDANGNPVIGIDTNGDGIPDTFLDADGNVIAGIDANGNSIGGIDTDGDGIPDTIRTADGQTIAAIDTDGDGTPDSLSDGSPLAEDEVVAAAPEPDVTLVRGTVQIDGDPESVAVKITQLAFDDPQTDVEAIGFRSAPVQDGDGKVWSARLGAYADLVDMPVRRSTVIPFANEDIPDANGAWLFSDVPEGRSYEVSFSSPNFDTQSVVVTPTIGGDPIDLDVEMEPSVGGLSGTAVGPNGALGSVAITVSDGTSTFSTSTAAGTGAWEIQRISTPGIYTVSARLRGFGTVVRQIELGPADASDGITLDMRPGLGTITGRVENTARDGLGGVTVTASNGEDTLTTTTFTDGEIGFYSLPELTVPGDYTVQAELDGFVLESRRVELRSSNADGVDFTMTSTTASLTGRVLSSDPEVGGIESAGLIVTTGDLQFRAATTAGTGRGEFELDRLPPGDYTITVEHFEHETATQFVTVVPGRPTAPLEITLNKLEGPPPVGTGSLTVEVTDADTTATTREVPGTRIVLSRNRTAQIWESDADASFRVTFDDLPIGTYTVTVDASAVGFNNPPPRTESVGADSNRTVPISVEQQGSASGTMINTLAPDTPLDALYSVRIFQLGNSGSNTNDEVLIGTFVADNGQWSTGDRLLDRGQYRLEASSPFGFVVRNDQILDDAAVVNGREMVFNVGVEPGQPVLPLVIPAIEAHPYPEITGTIWEPTFDGSQVGFSAIDDPTLDVTGECNGTPLLDGSITISDEFGASGNDRFDTFRLSGANLAQNVLPEELPATCTFTVGANDRVPQTITYAGLDASRNAVSADQLAAAALVKQTTALDGSVFWIDEGVGPDARVELGDVAIESTEDVIVGFSPRFASTTNTDPRPQIDELPIAVTSDPATGRWTLAANGAEQVFGTAVYQFDDSPDFAVGTVRVTTDQNGRTVTAVDDRAVVSTDALNDVGVRLLPPAAGTVTGQVRIATNRTDKAFSSATASATTPGDPVAVVDTATPDPTTGLFTLPLGAGSWNIAFNTPDNHQVVSNLGETPVGSVNGRLQPNGSNLIDANGDPVDVVVDFVELGELNLRVLDRSAATETVINSGIDIFLNAPTGAELVGDGPTIPDNPDPNGVFTVGRIPVSAQDPGNQAVTYDVALELAGFDLSRARLGSPSGTVVDARNLSGVPGATGPVDNLTSAILGGDPATLDLYVDPFRRITGSLVGQLTDGTTPPLVIDENDPTKAKLEITRVDQFGNPIVTGDPPPVLDSEADGTFAILAAPGFYRLTPSHPQFDGIAVGPTTGIVELTSGADVGGINFELELRPAELSVQAVMTLASMDEVADAVFQLEANATSCNGLSTTLPSTEIETGGTTISVAPGSYCMAVNKFNGAGEQIAFPAVVRFTVPRSALQEDGTIDLGTIELIAPLPPLQPTVIGTLVAENEFMTQVPLILPDPVSVTSTFTGATTIGVEGGAALDNETTASRDRSVVAEVTSGAPTYTFTLENVPAGSTITPPDLTPHYELITPLPIDLTVVFGVQTIDPIRYRAPNTALEINLGPRVFPSLDDNYSDRTTVSLKNPSADPSVPVSNSSFNRLYSHSINDDGDNILRFASVVPEAGGYQLFFDDALHGEVTSTFEVPIRLNGAGIRAATITPPTATLVRWIGAVQQRTSDTQTSNLTDAVMTLTPTNPTSNPTYVLNVGGTGSSDGASLDGERFQFDVVPGVYTLSVSKTGFVTTNVPDVSLPTAGEVVTRASQVEITRSSVVTIVLDPFQDLTAPADLQVQLFRNIPNDTELVPPRADAPLQFEVQPGSYFARATSASTGYVQTSNNTTVSTGASPSINLVLNRVIRVAVGPPTTPSTTATVEVAGTGVGPISRTVVTGSAVEFENTPTPSTGALQLKISAPGFRTRAVPNIPNTLVNAYTVNLLPDATIAGSIPGALAGTNTITATSNGDLVRGDTTAGAYTVAGLGVGDDGEDRTWTLTYDVLGAGTGSTTVTVASATEPTAPSIPLTVRNINYNFTVTPAPVTSGTNEATVAILNGANTVIDQRTTVGGLATVPVPENSGPVTWRVVRAGSDIETGPVGALPASLSQNIDAPIVRRAEVTGRVVDADATAVGLDAANVVVCSSTSTTPCAPTQTDRRTNSDPSGNFTLSSRLPVGSYKVWASKDGQSVSITLDVDDDGTETQSAPVIAVPTP